MYLVGGVVSLRRRRRTFGTKQNHTCVHAALNRYFTARTESRLIEKGSFFLRDPDLFFKGRTGFAGIFPSCPFWPFCELLAESETSVEQNSCIIVHEVTRKGHVMRESVQTLAPWPPYHSSSQHRPTYVPLPSEHQKKVLLYTVGRFYESPRVALCIYNVVVWLTH